MKTRLALTLASATLLFAATSPAQQPYLENDSELRQRYERGVHALVVEGDPARAIKLLDEVLATLQPLDQGMNRSDHAVVSAMQYRARMWLGEPRDPELERTFLAAAADDITRRKLGELIDLAVSERAAPEQVDPSFMSLVYIRLADDYAPNWVSLSEYGARLNPYLLEILKRARGRFEFYNSEVARTSVQTVENAPFIGDLSVPVALSRVASLSRTSMEPALAGAWMEMLQSLGSAKLPAWLSDSFIEFVVPRTEAQRQAFDDFLMRIASSEDSGIAAYGLELICTSLKAEPSARLEAYVLSAFSDPSSVVAPLLVMSIPTEAHRSRWRKLHRGRNEFPKELREEANHRYLKLHRSLAKSPLAAVADFARRTLLGWDDRESLRALASEGGIDDQLRLALAMRGMVYGHPQGRWSFLGSLSSVAETHSDYDPQRERDFLEAFAGSDDRRLRILAATTAAEHGRVDLLARALRDPDPLVRSYSVHSIPWQFGVNQPGTANVEPALVPVLATLLNEPDEAVRLRAAILIVDSRPVVHERAFLEALPHVNLPDKEWAARVLQALRLAGHASGEFYRDAFHVTISISPRARQEALRGWLSLRPEDGPDALDTVLNLDPGTSKEELAIVRDTWMKYWSDSVGPDRPLRQVEIETHERLYAALAARGVKAPRWVAFWRMLLDTGAPNAPQVVAKFLSNEDDLDRLFNFTPTENLCPWAVDILRSVADRIDLTTGIGIAQGHLVDGNRIAHGAGELVLEHGYPHIVQNVLGRMRFRPETAVAYRGSLIRLMANPELAASAADVLARVDKSPEVIALMLEAWEREDTMDRATLVHALGLTLDDRVVPVLLSALAGPHEAVSKAAGEALDRMKRVREERQAWELWKLTGGEGDSPIAALLLKAQSGKPEVRAAAIASLGTLRAKEALPMLVRMLEDDDDAIVSAARAALSKINE